MPTHLKTKTWHKRTYLLDGKEISSSEVIGLLHKAHKVLDNCAVCHEPIQPGQEYIKLNVVGGCLVHKDQFLLDHSEDDTCIIVVKRQRSKIFPRSWHNQFDLICIDFNKK